MIDEIFRDYEVNIEKLLKYKFKKIDSEYQYETSIMDGQFKLYVIVSNDNVRTKVIDNATNEEYVLYLMQDSVGEFVGKIREEIEKVLIDVRNKCFEKEVFKSEQAKQIIEHIRTKYDDELEFLWEKLPQTAVVRRKDNNKWYGVIFTLPKSKLGVDSKEIVEVIDLRLEPEKIVEIVDNKNIFTGYHRNKKHWVTFCLNGKTPTKAINDYIDNSYRLAK